MFQRCPAGIVVVCFTLLIAVFAVPHAQADVITGDATNFRVLYEGGGGNTLNTNNSNILGNVGIGGTGKFAASGGCTPGPCLISGAIDFAAANTGQFSSSGTTITGGEAYGQTNVQTDLNNLNSLSTTLGGEAGTALTVNLNNMQTQTVNATSGTLDASGNYVFDISSFTFNNGATLTLNNNGVAGDSIVFNFTSNTSFGGTIILQGFTTDQVLFNITGTGNTLQINTNGTTVQGDYLDPNGAVSINHSVLDGRLFGGDAQNMQIVSGANIVPEPSFFFVVAGLSLAIGLAALRKKLARQ